MQDLFKFVGEDGSLGYEKGKVYLLHLMGSVSSPAILLPHYCPYDSWELFLENWERVK